MVGRVEKISFADEKITFLDGLLGNKNQIKIFTINKLSNIQTYID
jgi:hypothetical protein